SADYLDAVDGIRASLPSVEQFVSLDQARPGWLHYETLLDTARSGREGVLHYTTLRAEGGRDVEPASIAEDDLLTINYTSGTTARPKGVMITHRNAYLNAVGTLVHVHMTPGERYLWTLPMFHASGWTFTWIVTAVGGTHVCLRKVEPAKIFE